MPGDDALASSLFRRAAAAGSDLGARLAAAIRSNEERLPDCLKASAPQAVPTQQQKMTICNKEASAKSLKGDERKQFMSECLKK